MPSITNIASLLAKVIPPKRMPPAGVSSTQTFNKYATNTFLPMPTYKEHLDDLMSTRQQSDSKVLIKTLMVQDPDMSASVNAILTVANTEPLFLVKDVNGMIDRPGQIVLNQILQVLTTRLDYSKGFTLKQSVKALSEQMRYMVLMRGAVSGELVVDKTQAPSEVRMVDPASLLWFETAAGHYVPEQLTYSGEYVMLDIPTFFVTHFRRDPTSIYSYSPFVSALNTIAARQQIINDLYRLMQLTGYPRMEVTVLEEVIKNAAPTNIRNNADELRKWINARLTEISNQINGIRPDQAFIHLDSVVPKIMNERSPAAGINIDSVVNTLNAQNQAGLRTMATIIGRGESGVNTASVEARIFSMTAEEINEPVAEFWSQLLTLAIRLTGSQSVVECRFRSPEMRPALELEPQLTMKSARLKEDLSLGIIDDDEYHMEMYGRIRPDSSPILSGTGFMAASGGMVNASNVTPNADPMGRSLTSPDSKSANRNTKKAQAPTPAAPAKGAKTTPPAPAPKG